VASIADKLRSTRHFVNQTKLAAEAKLSTTLLEVAQTNDLQVTRLYPKEAILLGYHPALKRKAIVTYSTNHGIKVWYWHGYVFPEFKRDVKIVDSFPESTVVPVNEDNV